MNTMKESLFDALKQLLIDSLALPSTAKKDEAKEEAPKTELLFDNISQKTDKAFRVLSQDEQQKLSVESLKGLFDFQTLDLLTNEQQEALLEKITTHSKSPISPHELKWLAMEILSHSLDLRDWMFLDFVLFPTSESCH